MKRRFELTPYLLLLPHALFFAAFVLYPLFRAFFMSAFTWGIFNGPTEFVGLKNFFKLFDLEGIRGSQFWDAVGVTLQFVVYTVPVFVAFALALALLFNHRFLRFKGFHLSAVFMPTALAVTIIACLWRMVFNDTGFVNSLIMMAGGDKLGWLSDLPGAWITLVVSTLWWTVGWNVILLLGGLQKVPETLYDAARVDGAGWWRTLFTVTLPGLKDVLFYVVTTQALASWGLFAQAQLMTKGMPGRATMPVALHIFGTAFGGSGDMLGLGSAMSILTGVLILTSTGVLYLLFGRDDGQESRR